MVSGVCHNYWYPHQRIEHKKKDTTFVVSFFLVEAGGVEPNNRFLNQLWCNCLLIRRSICVAFCVIYVAHQYGAVGLPKHDASNRQRKDDRRAHILFHVQAKEIRPGDRHIL